MKTELTSCALLAVVFLCAGCQSKAARIGADEPITAKRLIDRQLSDIKNDLLWQFSGTHVVIEHQKQPLPEYLLDDLALSRDQAVKTIEARWTFEAEYDLLRLTEVKLDGEASDARIELPIRPAGPIRVNLGSRQYNILKPDKTKRANNTNNSTKDANDGGAADGDAPVPALTEADLQAEMARHKTDLPWHIGPRPDRALLGEWQSQDGDRLPLRFYEDGSFQCGFQWRSGEGKLAKGLFASNEDGLVVAVASHGSVRLGIFYRLEADGSLYGSRGPSPRVAWKKVSNKAPQD